jgi:hypothetical protein
MSQLFDSSVATAEAYPYARAAVPVDGRIVLTDFMGFLGSWGFLSGGPWGPGSLGSDPVFGFGDRFDNPCRQVSVLARLRQMLLDTMDQANLIGLSG